MRWQMALGWIAGGLLVLGFTWAPFQCAVGAGVLAGVLIGTALLVEAALRGHFVEYKLSATFGHYNCHKRPQKHFSLEEINATIAAGWAGEK